MNRLSASGLRQLELFFRLRVQINEVMEAIAEGARDPDLSSLK